MRSYDKHRDTKYIQKSDLEKPVLVTIKEVSEDDVSGSNDPSRIKYVIHFEENYDPWVPNIGSLEEIKSIAGTGDVDRWGGTVIVLYVNPEVEYAGKKVGGIRCRAPKPGYSKQAQIEEPQIDETPPDDSNIPF